MFFLCLPILPHLLSSPSSILLSFLPPLLSSSSLSYQRPFETYLCHWSDSGASFSFLSGIILSSLSRVIVRIWYHKSILFTLLKSPPLYSMLLHIIYFRISLLYSYFIYIKYKLLSDPLRTLSNFFLSQSISLLSSSLPIYSSPPFSLLNI